MLTSTVARYYRRLTDDQLIEILSLNTVRLVTRPTVVTKIRCDAASQILKLRGY